MIKYTSVLCQEERQELRPGIDYREFHKRTVPDQHPIPRSQETLDNMGGNSWLSAFKTG